MRYRMDSQLDPVLLAENTVLIERHLARIKECLPSDPNQLEPYTDASDAVVLHLWQAIQVTLDLALVACLQFHAGLPNSYADAFGQLTRKQSSNLTERLARMAEVHEAIAHTYDRLDMRRIYLAAQQGPADLRAFLGQLRDLVT